MNRVTAIYYHHIVDAGKGAGYQCVEVQKFEEQMNYLHSQGYCCLTLDDLDKPLPEKGVLIVFDDGFRSVYEKAVPIMKQYGIRGNVFVPTKYVEGEHPAFMNWAMLEELQGCGMFCIGAHTHRHVDIRIPNTEALSRELSVNDALLAAHFGKEPWSFCMPYGKYNRRSVAVLRKHGYTRLFASWYGQITDRTKNGILPRIGISNDDTMGIFVRKLSGRLNWKGLAQRARLFLANIKGERIERYDIQ